MASLVSEIIMSPTDERSRVLSQDFKYGFWNQTDPLRLEDWHKVQIPISQSSVDVLLVNIYINATTMKILEEYVVSITMKYIP